MATNFVLYGERDVYSELRNLSSWTENGYACTIASRSQDSICVAMATNLVMYGERDVYSELRNLSSRTEKLMAMHVQLPRDRKISHYLCCDGHKFCLVR